MSEKPDDEMEWEQILRDGDDTPYGLEERTYEFAKRVRRFVKRVPRTVAHLEDVRQLVRASGSVAANFIEAIESTGAKDFAYCLRISKKEAKEARLFLRLLLVEEEPPLDTERNDLIAEAQELMLILSSIIRRHAPPS